MITRPEDVRIPFDYYYPTEEEMNPPKKESLLTPLPSATNPHHYTRWKIEPLKFCMENNLPFWLGNVIKYCMRYDAKDGLADLYKARVYLNEKINEMEGKGVRR